MIAAHSVGRPARARRVRRRLRIALPLAAVALALAVNGASAAPAAQGGGEPPATDLEAEARKAVAELDRARHGGTLDEVAYWVEQVGALRTPNAMRIVLAIGEEYPQDIVRRAVTESLRYVTTPEVFGFYGRELDSVRPETVKRAILIVEALDKMVGVEGQVIDLLTRLLERAEDQRLLVAVVRALRDRREKRCVDALIQFFKKVESLKDLVWQETRVSLYSMTEQQFTIAADWEAWWAVKREEWDEKQKARRLAEKAATAVYRPPRKLDLPQLFGVEVASKHVVFVIDCSSSMAERTAATDSEAGGNEGKIKIDRAQRELTKAILELRPDVTFNLVAFSTEAEAWNSKELVPASEANKRKALQFVERLKPDGTTSTEAGLMTAMEMPGVDTIILLSDGSPTILGKGTLAEIPPILEHIREANRFQQVTIHTLGFKGCTESFLKALARQNDGTYAIIH